MKKRSLLAVSLLLSAALLCACTPKAEKTDTTSQTTTAAETAINTETASSGVQWQDTPAHNAFRRTLKTIHDTLYLPNLTYVAMDYNSLTDISNLASCVSLVQVNVYGNPVTDVSALTQHSIIVNYDPTAQ